MRHQLSLHHLHRQHQPQEAQSNNNNNNSYQLTTPTGPTQTLYPTTHSPTHTTNSLPALSQPHLHQAAIRPSTPPTPPTGQRPSQQWAYPVTHLPPKRVAEKGEGPLAGAEEPHLQTLNLSTPSTVELCPAAAAVAVMVVSTH